MSNANDIRKKLESPDNRDYTRYPDKNIGCHICTKCDHFICDDIKHMLGHCNELDITRCAGDICIQ